MLRRRQFSFKILKGNCLLFFLVLLSLLSNAQTVRVDTATAVFDTLKPKAVVKHSPTKAAIFSAIIPGSGQIYNRKYWKVPVLYAGFGGIGYLFMKNNNEFRLYRDALESRSDTTSGLSDPFANIYDDQQLFTFREESRRYRDLCFIGLFAIYLLNVVDASVDAHMFTFDVSPDLSLNVRPYLPLSSPATGISLTLKF